MALGYSFIFSIALIFGIICCSFSWFTIGVIFMVFGLIYIISRKKNIKLYDLMSLLFFVWAAPIFIGKAVPQFVVYISKLLR